MTELIISAMLACTIYLLLTLQLYIVTILLSLNRAGLIELTTTHVSPTFTFLSVSA